MSEEYIKYWGLTQHPFLLAPDGNMMCVTGQYFECFERLKYAINTNKGGALIVSEDAGLGKTTILLKLIDELKEEYGKNFKYAYIDHPTLTAPQMIEQITGSITGQMPSDDKLKNLMHLKESLIETKKEGGKNIIVIDEGQMLCDAHDVLQELRALINLIHNNEYLHTFILSGQKTLWNTLQSIPEFWQRLPVRYYFTPLRFEETRELVRYRLNKAGLDVAREIFTEEALEIIHKHSKGLPRTIIALSDLALLNGFTDRTRKIGFKEVSKAINAMSGKGESLSYVIQERNEEPKDPVARPAIDTVNPSQRTTKALEYVAHNFKQGFSAQSLNTYVKPAIVVVTIMFFIFLGAMGHRLFSSGKPTGSTAVVVKEPEKTKVEVTATPTPEQTGQQETAGEKTDTVLPVNKDTAEAKTEKDVINAYREEMKLKTTRAAIVSVDGANVRSAPSLEAQRILTIVRGELLTIADEKTDQTGMKWYKVLLYNNRDGWIADQVVTITTIK
jgi:type II secretory pathway predicted ATPase ExeA